MLYENIIRKNSVENTAFNWQQNVQAPRVTDFVLLFPYFATSQRWFWFLPHEGDKLVHEFLHHLYFIQIAAFLAADRPSRNLSQLGDK